MIFIIYYSIFKKIEITNMLIYNYIIFNYSLMSSTFISCAVSTDAESKTLKSPYEILVKNKFKPDIIFKINNMDVELCGHYDILNKYAYFRSRERFQITHRSSIDDTSTTDNEPDNEPINESDNEPDNEPINESDNESDRQVFNRRT